MWLIYLFQQILTTKTIFCHSKIFVCVPGLPVHEHGGLPHPGPRPHLLHLDPDGVRLDAAKHRHGHLPRHGHHRLQVQRLYGLSIHHYSYLFIYLLVIIVFYSTYYIIYPCRGFSGSFLPALLAEMLKCPLGRSAPACLHVVCFLTILLFILFSLQKQHG